MTKHHPTTPAPHPHTHPPTRTHAQTHTHTHKKKDKNHNQIYRRKNKLCGFTDRKQVVRIYRQKTSCADLQTENQVVRIYRRKTKLCGTLFQSVGPWYATVRWPVDFVSTEGIGNRLVSEEERSCQEGTPISRVLATY